MGQFGVAAADAGLARAHQSDEHDGPLPEALTHQFGLLCNRAARHPSPSPSGPFLTRMMCNRKAFPKRGLASSMVLKDGYAMPDTVKFLLVLLCLGGAIYGGVWALANFPPEQAEIVKPLSSERLRAK